MVVCMGGRTCEWPGREWMRSGHIEWVRHGSGWGAGQGAGMGVQWTAVGVVGSGD